MEVRINGETVALPQSPLTLMALLAAHYGLEEDTPGVAVAVNEVLAPRSSWSHREVQPGDQIEVVHARQGG